MIVGYGLAPAAETGTKNGMPGFHDYTYRGKLPLEVELPCECPGGCGRRTSAAEKCAVCRGTYYYAPGKCQRCGYKPGGMNCRIICGGEPGTVRRAARGK